MAALSLSLLGPFIAVHKDKPLHTLKNSKVKALLIYIAVEKQHAHRRESLCVLLWPGMPEKSARHNLSQTIYALRRILPDGKDERGDPVSLLQVDRQTIQLNPLARVTLDIHQLDSFLESTQSHPHPDLAECPECIQVLEIALALYQGDFLSDFYLEDSNPFEEWAESIRESYRCKVIEILLTLAEIAIHNGEYEQAISYIDRQLSFDELRERAHRQKIEVLARSGRRVEAMRHYRTFAQLLEDQLSTAPSQETTALFERIRSEELPTSPPQTEPIQQKPATPRHNLILQPTPFIGREEELAQLDEMLRDSDIRLITIVAPGGMGKTRLALACAERQLDHGGGTDIHPFSDGVFFVPFTQVNEVDRIVFTIAEAINLHIESTISVSQSPKEQLLHYLRQRQILLLADNFEHLIPNAGLLAEILQNTPDVKVLVTSRERLNLRAEQVFSISGLPFSDWLEALEIVAGSPAAQLFIQSAQRFQPGFQIRGDKELASLALICQLTSGMPLALELAAGWVDMLFIAEIAAEIQRSLDFLETDLQDVPTRHRGIRAVFDSTWECLDPDERAVFTRFSVFEGGCTREAAQAVTGASLGMLASLVKKSLIQVRKTDDRYLVHELMRQYAAEKLVMEPNAEDATQHAHCTYYCTSLEKWEVDLRSARQSATVSKIKADYQNIRKAWYWAVDKMDLDNLTAAARGLAEYMDINYQRVEAELVFSRATHKIQETYGPEPEIPQAAWLLAYLQPRQFFTRPPNSDFITADYVNEKAENILLQSLALLKTPALAELDTRREQAYIQMYLGFVAHQDRRKYLEESLRLYATLGDLSGIAKACYEGFWVIDLVEDIQNLLTKNLEQLRQSGDTSRMIRTLLILGYKARNDGDYDQSFQRYEQAYAEALSGGHPIGMAEARRYAGHLNQFLGEFDKAMRCAEEGLELCHQTRYQYLSADFLLEFGVVETHRGHFSKAIEFLEKRIAGYQHIDAKYCYIVLAEAYLHLGQYENAVQAMNKGSSAIAYPWTPSTWFELKEGRYADASNDSRKKLAELRYSSEWYAWVQAPFGLALYGLDRSDEAKREFYQALQYCVEAHAFLPLMHLMPIIPVVLADSGDPVLQERAVELYSMTKTLPFVANSKLFEDIAEQPLVEATTHLPQDVILAAQLRGQKLDWWESAEVLLDELRGLGWVSSPN